MRSLRFVLIMAALLVVAGQLLQERRRLEQVKRLSGPEGRDLLERTRDRRERAMTVVTVLAAVAALVSTIQSASGGRLW